MSDDEELAASLRATLVVGRAEAAGIRYAPNGEGGLVAALDVDTEDGKWRFVLPPPIYMHLVSQCAALAALTPEQVQTLAAELHRDWLEQHRQGEDDE